MSSSTEARRFKMPSSLNESLKTGPTPAKDSDRSMEAAKEAKEGYTKQSKELKDSSDAKRSKPGITFAAQERLPKLPIPDLEATTKRYLESLEPLQSSRERDDTKAAIKDFVEHDGKELQDKLRK